jgi:signal transduction histidine kinase
LVLVVAQIKLADGAIATFRHAVPQAPADRPLRLLGLVAVTGITVALLAGWAVRRLTRPLTTLADAASGLARNLDRPPLDETGPTEVQRAAQAFNAMQRALKANLETRSQALAGVSHDLRLPITRAKLRLERVDDADVKRSIEADLDEMERMIADTLEFLRAGSGSEVPIRLNLNALIEGVAEDMEALGATVRVDGRADAPISGRPQALRRCLANIMDNARSHGGGSIEVNVSDAPQRVEIRIEDRGPGIPEAELERVFEPYVRLEPSRARHTGGAGLGLAIARAIARAHGGEVTLKNRSGGGLAAILTLERTGA